VLESVLRSLVPLIEPVGFVWSGLLLLTALLLRERRFRLGGALGSLALLVWIVGATAVPHELLASLERPWVGVHRERLPEADAIVVLGGASTPSREEVGGLHFASGADRAVTALELGRLGKAKTLVIGGSAASGSGQLFSEADLFGEFVKARKLGPPEVISLGICRDTHDEAEKVRDLGRERAWRRVLLVTSAAHMNRASAAFRTTTGLEIVPAPCGFATDVSIVTSRRVALVPRAPGFVILENWLHETVGWAVYRFRGWIADSA
jgi:uncharacterized SAM-binding protein YcdF (DUF218 family)